MKELTQVERKVQIKADRDLETSIEVDTDLEKTVQSAENVDEKSGTAPKFLITPMLGLAHGSTHTRPIAQTPTNVNVIFSAYMSAELP